MKYKENTPQGRWHLDGLLKDDQGKRTWKVMDLGDKSGRGYVVGTWYLGQVKDEGVGVISLDWYAGADGWKTWPSSITLI
jgi:hypothetical protein